MNEKLVLATMKMEKTRKYEDMRECMKEAAHRALKLVENWGDEGLIAGIIDTDGMVRRDDFVDLDNECINLEQ